MPFMSEMKKKVLAKLEKCYSIAPLWYHGETHILVAAEKQNKCLLFDEDGILRDTVWEGPGGVMSMAQIPGSDGQFLATQKFYSPNDSKEAKIVLADPGEQGGWNVRTLIEIPFVHRFDILCSNGVNYLIACTIKSDHNYKDDWSSPGKVYAAKLPDSLDQVNEQHPLQLEVIKDGMLKNHGYCKVKENGREFAVICSENGVFQFYPPENKDENWKIVKILDMPVSDAVMIDLDNDGMKELVTLSPFHGDELRIYKAIKGQYHLVYEYPEKAEFLHAVWSGMIEGKPVAVVGHRKGARRLLMLWWDQEDEKYSFRTIDDDCGPANVYGYNRKNKDVLIAANRETDEIAMYVFS